ncbi:hypothetical protein JL722_2640 [Aureococcus anophagefferens]|nr:hypothetical protein JL722_2640 [Aureococcus anophagefferens]
MEAAFKLLIVVATLGSSRAYNGTARRLEGDGSPAFLAIGSFDESHAARRALIRRTYAAGLAPMADYAFYVQNASAAELRDAGDVVAAPHADVSRCGFAAEGKACRSGEVFLAGLEDYLRRSTRPYVLAIDDDGFLCRAAFQRAAKMLVRRGKTEGFVGGTWQRKGKDLVRPDQNFVLLSRDVATKAAAALRKAFAALGASHKTGTRDAAKLLAAQRFAMDLRDAVLHPHHNSLALLYQRERPGGRSFREKRSRSARRVGRADLRVGNRAAPRLLAPREGRRRVRHLELRRAGGTDAFDVVDEHSVLTAARREHSFTVGVSREPCDYYVSARAWGKTGRADFGLPGPETADHGKGWFALAVGAKDPAEWRDVHGDGPGAFAAWLRRASPERDGPRCGLLSMRLYTAVVAPEAAASINPPGCENARPAIAAGVGCPCPLADCAGAANDAQHAACAAALETADPAALFDCRLRLETVDADLAACLRRFEARGGAVAHPKPAGGPPPSRERRHAATAELRRRDDAETRSSTARSTTTTPSAATGRRPGSPPRTRRGWRGTGATSASRTCCSRRRWNRGAAARHARAAPGRRPKVWQRWRAALGGGDDPRTEAGAANLRRRRRAGDLFDVVVVVERWEDSMALLDCRVPLRDGTWADLAGAHLNTHGSEQHGDRAAAALSVARADPAVAEEIAADTAIYSAALALFERMRASTEACAS